MFQLNNDAEENTAKNEVNNKNSKSAKKEEKVRKKHSTRNMIIFMILFAVVCIGITMILILKSHGTTDITDLKNIAEDTIKKDNETIAPDGLGLDSLNETYRANPIKVTYVNVGKTTSSEEQNTCHYVEIDGLANEEIEQSINTRIKEEFMAIYSKHKNESDLYLVSNCYANFGNVMSFFMTYQDDENSITKGFNYNLATGEELKFNDLFANTAPIKSILSNAIYNSLAEEIADGIMIEETSTYSKDNESQFDDAQSKKRREKELAEIEVIAFKMLNFYNSGGEFNYYFSPRQIYIEWNENTISIPMYRYYNQIAIYNRYKDNSNIYDGQFNNHDVIENNSIPVLCSANDVNVIVDFNQTEPVFVNYLNISKVSDNMIVSVYNDLGLNNVAILENPEEFKSAQEIIKKYIEEHKKDDGKARFVQINMGFGYDDYEEKDKMILDCTISEYSIANKDKEKFFDELLEYYRRGSYAIYWEPDYQSEEFEGLDVKLNQRNFYDDKSLSYVYNKSAKKWESEITENIIPPEVTNPEKTTTPEPSQPVSSNGKVIVIDPGHQVKANSEKEPIGPGASQTKAKVTGGATGVATGKTEYQLNLEVSLKLKTALENKGYTVIMTRATNDVNLSNSERAQIANNANAAAFIRIHANSVDTSSVKGVLTMCQTASNPYNGNLAAQSYSLSKAVLDNFVSETGAVNKGVTRTDDMSGINWCKVPTTIVEMGFMSNPEEDKLMATDEYQNKMVNGIVKGIEQFFINRPRF